MKLTHDNFTISEYVNYGLDSTDRLTKRLAEFLAPYAEESPHSTIPDDFIEEAAARDNKIESLEGEIRQLEYTIDSQDEQIHRDSQIIESLRYDLEDDCTAMLIEDLKGQTLRAISALRAANEESDAYRRERDKLASELKYLQEKHNTFTILATE